MSLLTRSAVENQNSMFEDKMIPLTKKDSQKLQNISNTSISTIDTVPEPEPVSDSLSDNSYNSSHREEKKVVVFAAHDDVLEIEALNVIDEVVQKRSDLVERLSAGKNYRDAKVMELVMKKHDNNEVDMSMVFDYDPDLDMSKKISTVEDELIVNKRTHLVKRLSAGKDYRDAKVMELVMKKHDINKTVVDMNMDYDPDMESMNYNSKRTQLVKKLSAGKDYRDAKVMELVMKKHDNNNSHMNMDMDYDPDMELMNSNINNMVDKRRELVNKIGAGKHYRDTKVNMLIMKKEAEMVDSVMYKYIWNRGYGDIMAMEYDPDAFNVEL